MMEKKTTFLLLTEVHVRACTSYFYWSQKVKSVLSLNRVFRTFTFETFLGLALPLCCCVRVHLKPNVNLTFKSNQFSKEFFPLATLSRGLWGALRLIQCVITPTNPPGPALWLSRRSCCLWSPPTTEQSIDLFQDRGWKRTASGHRFGRLLISVPARRLSSLTHSQFSQRVSRLLSFSPLISACCLCASVREVAEPRRATKWQNDPEPARFQGCRWLRQPVSPFVFVCPGGGGGLKAI